MNGSGTTSWRLVLVISLVLGGALRFHGLDWGTDRETGFFHRFHTDESTIVENTRWVGEDLTQVRTSWICTRTKPHGSCTPWAGAYPP